MNSEDVKNLYTKNAALYDFFFLRCLGYKKGLKAFFKKEDLLTHEMIVLDMGCGTGALTKSLYKLSREKEIMNINFFGVDLTPAMLDRFCNWIDSEKKKKITVQQANIIYTNFENIKNKIPKADLIVSSAMLEYIPKKDFVTALKNIKTFGKKGASCFIFITKKNIISKVLINWWWKANMYKKEELVTALKESGFTNIEFKSFPFPYCYFNKWGHVVKVTI